MPRRTVEGDYDMPAIVACYKSLDGASLYQTEHGNWALHEDEEAWTVPSCTYLTWDERKNDYGHRRGSPFVW